MYFILQEKAYQWIHVAYTGSCYFSFICLHYAGVLFYFSLNSVYPIYPTAFCSLQGTLTTYLFQLMSPQHVVFI